MPDGRVRVLSWNTWWRFGPDWRARQALLLDAIRDSDADVVALQESWRTAESSQADELGAALGFSRVFAGQSLPPLPEVPEHPDQAEVELGVALVSRWPILDVRAEPLPARHRPETPVTLVATIDHPAAPLPVLVTCLEWEPAYADDRIAQARRVADLATDPALDGPAPIVVAGDLNAAPGSPVLRPLLDVLTDAWAVGGGDQEAASLPRDHPDAPVEATELLGTRIDHVLVRPGRPGQRISAAWARTLGDPVDGLHPSDHRAVVVDLSWSELSPR